MGSGTYSEELHRALELLDIEWAKKCLPFVHDDFTVLVALHKTRVECTGVSRALRLQSVEWLRAYGFRRNNGLSLPPPGVLPSDAA